MAQDVDLVDLMLLYLVPILNNFTNSQSYFILALLFFNLKFKINQTKFNIDQVLDDWL